MKNIIFCVSKIFFSVAFLTGCEVGITPLDYGDTDPSVGVIVTEVPEVIDGENGGSILEVSNVPEQITFDDIQVELTGVGSENFETIVDLSNNIFTVTAKPIEGFSVREDTTFNLFATVYINGLSSCVKPIVITLKGTNTQPIISGIPATTVNEDTAYSFTPTATDVDANETLTFSIVNKPTWASFDNTTGALTGTPDNADVGITTGIEISVTDSTSTSTLTAFDITVVNTNDAPLISGTPATAVNADSPYSFTPTATDVDVNDTLTFNIVNQPTWASFDNTTGALTGTPDNADVGITTGIEISVTDGSATSTLPVFDITVVNTNDAPLISGTPATAVNADSPYSFTPTATDVDVNDTLTFNIVNQPTWASFDNTTGALTGTPDNADVGITTGIEISVTDGSATSTLPVFDIEVLNTNDAPVISGTPATTVNEDTAYSFTPTATDVDANDNLTFSIVNKPTWASFDNATGALTGTPDNADVGITTGIEISVTDGSATSTLPVFDITVLNTNDVPVAYDNNITLYENTTRIIILRGQDDDGDFLQFAITQPANGTVVLDGDEVTYTPDANFIGTDSFTFVANDGQIDSLPATITMSVISSNITDVTAPVITANGFLTVSVEAGTIYIDAGATALDDNDGDITANILTVNTVNTNIPNTYTVTYDVNDTAGNIATQVERNVTVEDTTNPVLTLNGDAVVNVVLNTSYVDLGASAADSLDGDITASITTVNPVNINQIGSYIITYNVQDTAGNTAVEVSRTVNVADISAPVITLLGTTPVDVEYGSSYTDAGATAFDSGDGDLTANIAVGGDTVDTNTLGTYIITYDVNDSSSMSAIQVQRVVNVVDTVLPTITLIGADTVIIEMGTNYTDEGATATDNVDGDITVNINTINPVDTNLPGAYVVSYDVSDGSSNEAAQVLRTVVVTSTGPLPPIFKWCSDARGEELWTSDGTVAGTSLLKDISLSGSSNPEQLTEVNGTLFFTADNGTDGKELWRTNGLSEGTLMVKDITGDGTSASPDSLTHVGSTLFFTADDKINGVELWKSDGTETGTEMVEDIAVGVTSSSPKELTNLNGTLFFTADDTINGVELWKSDGTSSGTEMVEDITLGAGNTPPYSLTDVNGTLFFAANDGISDYELWKSDGMNTVMITDVDSNLTNPQYITNVNGIAYFSMYDDIYRTELWKSNGNIGNLELVRDIEKGDKPEDSSWPQELTEVNGILYFTRLKSDGKKELWRTDEKDGAKKVGHSDTKEVLQNLTNVNGRLYYSDFDKNRKYRLWWIKGNGDAEKLMVFDPVDGLSEFRNVNGVLYFRVIKNDAPDELWTSESVIADIPHPIATGCLP